MEKTKKCKHCKSDIDAGAKICPVCKKKQGRSGCLVAIILAVVVVGGGAAMCSGGNTPTGQPSTETAVATSAPASDTSAASQPAQAESKTDTSVPTEYKSALKKAQTYSDMMHMSKKGIYDQLTSEYGEKFTAEAAQYAMDNVKADWNKNALEKAKTYQETMSMSPEAIRDQLTSEYGEQFTAEEAAYAIENLN